MEMEITLKTFQCHDCNKIFNRRNNFIRHTFTHTGERPFLCELCGSAFAEKKSLEQHELVHTGKKLFLCETCGTYYKRRTGLNRHVRSKHSDVKPFRCSDCGVHFTRNWSLTNHHLIQHQDSKPFICECGKGFANKSSLTCHKRMSHPKAEKPYWCDYCGLKFSGKECFIGHICPPNWDFKSFKCAECGKGFEWKKSITKHIRNHMQ